METLIATVGQLTDDDDLRRHCGYLLIAAALVMALVSQSCYWGFVQDDAYISLRYSRHLVQGEGIVFNPGERVEGYSNFLWMLLGALFIALGVDPINGLTVVGAICGLALVAVMPVLAATVRGQRSPGWDGLASLLLAGSTTLALWSVSGLEQSFFALCGWVGFMCTVHNRPWPAMACFSLTVLTRPEGALFPLFAGLYLVLSAVGSDGSRWRPFVAPACALAAVCCCYHGWRYWYFGDLLPNTYYVKGGGGWTNVRFGWLNIQKLWAFNCNGLLIMLAPLALVLRPGREAALTMVVFLFFYLCYQVKIGGDILPKFRLHLTVLPAQMILALRALETVGLGAREVIKEKYQDWLRLMWPVVVMCLVAYPIGVMYTTSMGHTEYRGVRKSLDGAHGAIGRYIQRHSRPGDVAVAQDMGALPWEAPDVVFLDTIGLCDRTMAHTHYRESYTPYIRYMLWEDSEARARIRRMEAELRRYTFSRNPRWFVINVDLPADKYDEVLEALRARHGEYFAPWVEANVFFYDLGKAPQWRQYRFVKGWEYSNVHFLLLFERQDDFYDRGGAHELSQPLAPVDTP